MENTKNNLSDITLLKDRDWSIVEDEPCRVIDFVPWGFIKDGKITTINKTTPYAGLTLESKKFLNQKITGFITHKIDFIHLWAAFKERTVKENEEVIIFWSRNNYTLKLFRFLSWFMPKLWVMVCPKGAYELMAEEKERRLDPSWKPELDGLERWNAMRPIEQWKPRSWKY